MKSLHNDAGLNERIEFLREASIIEECRLFLNLVNLTTISKNMETAALFLNAFFISYFASRTEHVVKLVGMVTTSLPVLVLMEFMENGDLECFLKKHRQESF